MPVPIEDGASKDFTQTKRTMVRAYLEIATDGAVPAATRLAALKALQALRLEQTTSRKEPKAKRAAAKLGLE